MDYSVGVYFSFLFLRFLFTYLFREIESKRGRSREKGRERIPSRLCTVIAGPDVGLELTNCEIMT